jgi:hypothetical protein
LLAKHCEEGGKEGSGETREEDGLDVDDRAGRACPLWEGGDVISEGGVIDLIDKDTEEGGGLGVRVLLEVRVDLDDECGGHCREQTGLGPSWHVHT